MLWDYLESLLKELKEMNKTLRDLVKRLDKEGKK